MNYRHIYHAGCFADAFKHVLLISLVQSLSQKNKPFYYLDTHAGIGNYDLLSKAALKTGEFKEGIASLWEQTYLDSPELINQYLQMVKDWNTEKGESTKLQYYPGSPIFVQKLLRPNDRMVLSELHPEDVLTLKTHFRGNKHISIHHIDAWHALKAFLPPKENRGLVLIDPPFEKTDEFEQIIEGLKTATHRFSAGIFAVWYPIKNLKEVSRFYQSLQGSGIRKILCCEISLANFTDESLRACGMVIINPPWQWETAVEPALMWLADHLNAPKTGKYRITWLVHE